MLSTCTAEKTAARCCRSKLLYTSSSTGCCCAFFWCCILRIEHPCLLFLREDPHLHSSTMFGGQFSGRRAVSRSSFISGRRALRIVCSSEERSPSRASGWVPNSVCLLSRVAAESSASTDHVGSTSGIFIRGPSHTFVIGKDEEEEANHFRQAPCAPPGVLMMRI